MELIKNLCNPEGQRLLERLNKYILSEPTLERPDPSRRFYIKTDWYKDGMGAVLLQEDVSEEARKLEAQEKDDGNCEFDTYLEGMHLQPIYLSYQDQQC